MSQDLKKRLFDFWSSSREYFEMARAANIELTEHKAQMLDYIHPGARVLDVACGSAENGMHISKFARYVGIDIACAGLHLANEFRNDRFELVRGDVAWLPFASESFDIVISTYSLEHFVEPRKVLDEIFRVCSVGGKTILISPTYDLPFQWPPSHQSKSWKLRLAVRRLVRQIGASINRNRFLFDLFEGPDCLRYGYQMDNDVVHLVWSREIIAYLRYLGCELVYVREARRRFSYVSRQVAALILTRLQTYRDARDLLFVVMEKRGESS